MPYNSSDSEHTALLGELEFRIDEVVATGQTPAIDRTQAYLELERAGNQMLMEAPISILMRDISEISGTVNPNVVQNDRTVPFTDNVSTIIPLPLTYLRFVSLSMKGWAGWPERLDTTNSQVHMVQQNANSRADYYHPVAVLVPYFVASTHDQAIECFPQDTTTNPVDKLYVALEKDPEDFSELLRDPLIWLGAARMMAIFQDGDGFQAAMGKYRELLSQLNAGVLNAE